MKRLWTAILTSLLTVSPGLAQSTSAPMPRAIAPEAQPAGPIPGAPVPNNPGPPVNPMTGVPYYGPESYGETFESGPVEARRRVWGAVDYILWQAKGDKPPALVTTSPVGTPAGLAGVMGAPNTSLLFGNQQLNDQYRSGIKLELGAWLDSGRTFGIQAGAFFLVDSSEGQLFASDGTFPIFRPATLVGVPAGNAAAPVSLTNANGLVISGGVEPREVTRTNGFDVAFRSLGCCGPCWRFDTLIGYRYLHLNDRFSITEAAITGPAILTVASPPAVPGQVVNSVDQFETDNVFHGVEIGITGEYRFNERWSLEGTVKASYGYLNEKSSVNGFTTTTFGGVTVGNIGGLLALPGANIGTFARSEGQLVPELNLNVNYDITERVRFRAGYSFLYLDNVFRAAQRIDTTINTFYAPLSTIAQNPGATPVPVRPQQTDQRTDYYLHGFNVGLEFRF